uniref:Methyltransferase FkbM family n=1 Tax=Mycolicibacterium gilvum (strain PYR-GCK) TaxID=350054 RepID=A4TF42_MYCGI|nr:methyltransferase FkbM family [Mycolicibacterium gilvum PYR-GCK]
MDEALMVHRVIGGTTGTMVDVGAHHGSAFKPFLDSGWVVHAFEPDPANRKALQADHPRLTVDTRAVAEVDGEEVRLFTSDISTGISTLSPFHATHKPTSTVQTVRLDSYLRDNNIARIDFLKTDVEGYDLYALRSFPWSTHHPRVVLCEYEDAKTIKLGHDSHAVAQFLQKQGYEVLVSEWHPIVEYGSEHQWRRFCHYPTDLAPESWGNLIAADPNLIEALERCGRLTVRRLRVRSLVDRFR